MAIDPTPAPDMHLSGKAPEAHKRVMTEYANLLYGNVENAGFGAVDQPDLPGRTQQLRQAVRNFYLTAQASMQTEMDALNPPRKAPEPE